MDTGSISEEGYLMSGPHSSSILLLVKIPGYYLVFFLSFFLLLIGIGG